MRNPIKTRKLKSSISRITDRAKNLKLDLNRLTVYGVSKEDGISVTGKNIGKNLGNYFYFEGQKFAYNPYRINIGSIGLSSPNFVGLISPAYVVFEVDKTIYPEFLLLYLKSNVGIRWIKWYGDRGGVRSSLRFSDLGEIDFPDITYEEQKTFYTDYLNKLKIVEKANSEFDKQLELIFKLRKSILQDAVQGKLTQEWRIENINKEDSIEFVEAISTRIASFKKSQKKHKSKSKWSRVITENEKHFKIPDGWEWFRLGDLCKFKHGFAFKGEFFTNEPTPYILTTPGNFFEGGGFRDRELKRKYYYGPVNSEFILEAKDLIIPMTEQASGLLGSPAFIPDDGKTYLHNQRLGKIIFDPNIILPEFSFLFFNSSYFRNELARTSTGMKVRHTSAGRVLSVPFPVCSISEQNQIVDKANFLLNLCNQLEEELEANKAKTKKLMLSIISELLGQDDSMLINEAITKKETKKPLRKINHNRKTTLMDLVKLLEINGSLHAEELWQMSKFPNDIDAFYAELKKQIEKMNTIKEGAKKGYLELV